jgi:hypothetical protein
MKLVFLMRKPLSHGNFYLFLDYFEMVVMAWLDLRANSYDIKSVMQYPSDLFAKVDPKTGRQLSTMLDKVRGLNERNSQKEFRMETRFQSIMNSQRWIFRRLISSGSVMRISVSPQESSRGYLGLFYLG